MKEHLQTVLIGPGKHAIEHLIPQLIDHPLARIAAIVGRDAEKLEKTAKRFNIDTYSDDWDSYSRTMKCDAVFVSATPQAHAAILAELIPRGIPVYVEKPPAPDLESLIKLSTLQESYKSRVTVGYNFLYASAYKRLIESIGDKDNIAYTKVSLLTNKPTEQLWGHETVLESLLYAVGIHGLAIANDMFFNCSVLNAHCANLEDGRMRVHVTLLSAAGQLIVLELGNHAALFGVEIEVLVRNSNRYIMKDLRTIFHYPANGARSFETEEVFGIVSPESRGGYANILSCFLDSLYKEVSGIRPLAWSIPIYRNIRAILDRVSSA